MKMMDAQMVTISTRIMFVLLAVTTASHAQMKLVNAEIVLMALSLLPKAHALDLRVNAYTSTDQLEPQLAARVRDTLLKDLSSHTQRMLSLSTGVNGVLSTK